MKKDIVYECFKAVKDKKDVFKYVNISPQKYRYVNAVISLC